MNRLWVRFSLAFAAVVFIVVMVAATMAYLADQTTLGAGPEVPPEVADYYEEVRRERGPLTATPIIIIVGGVAIIAGVWMSRSLTAPMSELEDAAGAIGRQELSYRVPVHGSQEMVAVATAFNDMAAQLEKAETLRQNLLADVAHELRHPIHVLRGNLQAILDDVYPMNKEEIARLSDQARHLTVLVNDLHILAQAEAHQLPMDKQMTDIAALVKETAVAFQPLAAADDVTLRVELLGTMPSVEVDADRFRQVVHNLMDNALRHTPEGGAITVCVEQVAEAVQLLIRDTGEGIPPEQLPYVFDRFYRGDPARSRDRGGSGLGLAIVKAIVEEHGGMVSVESPGVGQGSTFTITLPNAVI